MMLRERGIMLPVVMLTAHGDVATTRAALKAGALDFLEKPFDEELLIEVLRNAIHIDQVRHGATAARIANASLIERLTPREREVFDFLTDGLQNRAVAQRLGISPRTVEVYKARIMEKLQCRNIADAVKLRLGMV